MSKEASEKIPYEQIIFDVLKKKWRTGAWEILHDYVRIKFGKTELRVGVHCVGPNPFWTAKVYLPTGEISIEYQHSEVLPPEEGVPFVVLQVLDDFLLWNSANCNAAGRMNELLHPELYRSRENQ